MISWVAAHVTSFDFLLKTDVDTLICFSMVTDMLDAVRKRYQSDQQIYLGHFETCSKIHHFTLDKFYDPFYMADLLYRDDAPYASRAYVYSVPLACVPIGRQPSAHRRAAWARGLHASGGQRGV